MSIKDIDNLLQTQLAAEFCEQIHHGLRFFSQRNQNLYLCRLNSKGVKNQASFSQMQEMHYDLAGVGTVKMMVGIKRTGEIIQYCITAIQK